MIIHPVFTDILMHSDDELETILESKLTSRKTIHEWPLSCVQELILRDGTKLIYKAQLPPTVEPCFYQQAESALLPAYRCLGKLGDCDTMIIDWIDAPLLSKLVRSDIELVEHGRKLVAQIGEIKGELPNYLDIGSVEAWIDTGQIMFNKLDKLIRDGRFQSIDIGDVERVRAWTMSDKVYTTITDQPRVTHGDLKADQVFVTEDGYRIIDWQRPVVAPPELDLVTLLVEQGVEPRQFIDKTIVGIFWFLRLYWAVEAQFDLFPGNRWPLFEHWASEAITQMLGV